MEQTTGRSEAEQAAGRPEADQQAAGSEAIPTGFREAGASEELRKDLCSTSGFKKQQWIPGEISFSWPEKFQAIKKGSRSAGLRQPGSLRIFVRVFLVGLILSEYPLPGTHRPAA